MAEKSRVLLVSRPATGGMKIHLRRLAEGLSGEFECALAAPDGLPEQLGVRGYRLDIPDRLSPARLPFLVMRLVGIIRRDRPRILHAHGYVAGTVAAMAGSLARTPVILCTLHNLFPAGASPVGRKALQICGRSCARLIAVSEAVKASAVAGGGSADKIEVIPNGIELEPFDEPVDPDAIRSALGIGPTAPVVLTASRLIPAKGIDILLQAAVPLRREFPDLRVVIAGDGPFRSELVQLAEKLGLGGCAMFLGERDDIPTLLMASDIVAVPSWLEGQSLLVLEGMAARKPVVASNIGGMAEMIRDGVTGLLVPPRDPAALSRALSLALGDRALCTTLGESGRRYVEAEMTLEKMLIRTRALYRKMLVSSAVGPDL